MTQQELDGLRNLFLGSLEDVNLAISIVEGVYLNDKNPRELLLIIRQVHHCICGTHRDSKHVLMHSGYVKQLKALGNKIRNRHKLWKHEQRRTRLINGNA